MELSHPVSVACRNCGEGTVLYINLLCSLKPGYYTQKTINEINKKAESIIDKKQMAFVFLHNFEVSSCVLLVLSIFLPDYPIRRLSDISLEEIAIRVPKEYSAARIYLSKYLHRLTESSLNTNKYYFHLNKAFRLADLCPVNVLKFKAGIDLPYLDSICAHLLEQEEPQ